MHNETLQSVDGQKIANAKIYRLKNENPARPVIQFQFLSPDSAPIRGRLQKLCRHEIVQRVISLACLFLLFSNSPADTVSFIVTRSHDFALINSNDNSVFFSKEIAAYNFLRPDK
jgi:hypothetical protein